MTSKWSKGAEALQQGAQFGGNCIPQPVASTLGNRGLRSHTELDGHGAYIPQPVAFAQNQREEVREVDVPGALSGPGTHQQTYVAQPVPIQDGREIQKAQNGIGIGQQGDPAYTLDTTGAQAIGQPIPFTKAKRAQSTEDDETWVDGQVNPTLSLFDQGDTRATTVAVVGAIPIDGRNAMRDADKLDEMNRQGMGVGNTGDPSHTVTSACVHAVAFKTGNSAKARSNGESFEVTPTIGSDAGGNTIPAVAIGTDCYNGAITGDVAATMGTPGSSVNASGPTVMQAHAFYSPVGTHGVNQHPEVSPAVKVGSGLGIPSPPAVAHALRAEGFDASEDGTGRGTPLVPMESLQQQGYNVGHASTQEANAIATLRVLRDEIGEEAFSAWGLGVLDSLQPSQVLRARLHGEGIRCASFSRSWPIDCAISRPEDRAAWAVQSVREAEGERCSPSGRELPQQLSEQLGAYLSQLPHAGPQVERFMHHLWCASEGVGVLRQALSAIQEARRSADVPRTTPATTMTVRRLTATECEFLQGFPRNWTLIPWRKKAADECPDGPRYKALGNSMAVNCMEWIGERIDAWERKNKENA